MFSYVVVYQNKSKIFVIVNYLFIELTSVLNWFTLRISLCKMVASLHMSNLNLQSLQTKWLRVYKQHYRKNSDVTYCLL